MSNDNQLVAALNYEYLKYMTEANPDDFRQVIHEYWQDVWNYAYFLTRNPDLSDDLTQEVFVKAYSHIQSFRAESSVKTWLLKIMRNLVINHRKSAFFRKVIVMGLVHPKQTSHSAEREYLERYRLNAVWKTVMQLSDKYREVLILDAKYELSMEEIAAMLGISLGTVKSRLHRARAKVTELLRKEGEE